MDFSTPLKEPTQNFTEYTKQVFTDPVNQLRIKQLGIAFTTGAIISYSAFKYIQLRDAENQANRDDVAYNNRNKFNKGNPFINNNQQLTLRIDSSDEDDDSSSLCSENFAFDPKSNLSNQKQLRSAAKSKKDELLLLKLRGQANKTNENLLYFDSNDEMYTEEEMLTIVDIENKQQKTSHSMPTTPNVSKDGGNKFEIIEDLKKQLYNKENKINIGSFFRKQFSVVKTDIKETIHSPSTSQQYQHIDPNYHKITQLINKNKIKLQQQHQQQQALSQNSHFVPKCEKQF